MMRVANDSVVLDSFDSTDGWAVLGSDTTGLAAVVQHVTGTKSLEFDKVDGAANTIFAGISKTRTSPISLGGKDGGPPGVDPRDTLRLCCYLSSLTDVAYVFLRLGSSASHYSEWRAPKAELTAAVWNTIVWALDDTQVGVTGVGWDPDRVDYMAVGIAFNAEANTLADIRMDHLAFMKHFSTGA